MKHQKGKPVIDVGKVLPDFGAYRREKQIAISEMKLKIDLLSDDLKPSQRNINKPDNPVPKVKVSICILMRARN